MTYGFSSGTAGGTLIFGQNSAATNLAQLEFTSVNFGQGGHSGYWLDNIAVNTTTVPEPTSTIAMFAIVGLGCLAQRRRKA